MTDTTPRAPQPVDDADTPVEVEAALADPSHTYPVEAAHTYPVGDAATGVRAVLAQLDDVDARGFARGGTVRAVSAGSPAARLRAALAAHPPTGRLDIRYAQTSAADPLDDLAAVLEAVEGVALVAADAVGTSQTLHVTTVRAELAPAVLPSGAAAREAQRAAQSAALSAELGIPAEPPAITAMHQAVDVMHLERAAHDTTPLGQLIDALADALIPAGPTADVIYAGAGRDDELFTGVHSWRGDYADLAMGHAVPDGDHDRVSLHAVLLVLRGAVGSDYEGWKGGTYTMHRSTPVWCDNPGQWTQVGIAGVDAAPGRVTIRLEEVGDRW